MSSFRKKEVSVGLFLGHFFPKSITESGWMNQAGLCPVHAPLHVLDQHFKATDIYNSKMKMGNDTIIVHPYASARG